MLVQPDGEEHPLALSAFRHWRWPPRPIGCLVVSTLAGQRTRTPKSRMARG